MYRHCLRAFLRIFSRVISLNGKRKKAIILHSLIPSNRFQKVEPHALGSAQRILFSNCLQRFFMMTDYLEDPIHVLGKIHMKDFIVLFHKRHQSFVNSCQNGIMSSFDDKRMKKKFVMGMKPNTSRRRRGHFFKIGKTLFELRKFFLGSAKGSKFGGMNIDNQPHFHELRNEIFRPEGHHFKIFRYSRKIRLSDKDSETFFYLQNSESLQRDYGFSKKNTAYSETFRKISLGRQFIAFQKLIVLNSCQNFPDDRFSLVQK